MRKFFIILASLAVAGCMVSEISEETVYVNIDYPTYTATFDDESTKVYVDTDLKMHWNAGDEISIFRTTGNQRYSFDGADGDREGTFTVQGDPQGGSELQRAYAVYPYSEDTSINTDGLITLNLPSVQNYAENSFGQGANTMVAVTESKESDKLYFKNLCGYLVVKLYGEGTIKSITLTGNNGEKLSGQATVVPVHGEVPILTMSESAGNSITLDCGEGVALGSTAENATAFWFAVPPVTYSKGFTIEITDGASCTTSKETSIERTIERNVKNSIQSLQINQTANQLAMERDALIELYMNGGGNNWDSDWGYDLNWCTSQPLSSWAGVTTDDSGYVKELYILGYSGSLPASIGVFSHLRSLVISGHLIGEIPVEIGKLTELEVLNLLGEWETGGLTGSIPKEVFSLKQLRELSLPSNSLTGEISADFAKLKELEVLSLENNRLTGTLPKELAQCEHLRYVNLKYNRLSGVIPEEIMSCAFWRDSWGMIIQEYANYVSVFWGEGNSFSTDNLIIPAPIIDSSYYCFTDGTEIVLKNIYPKNKLTLLYDWDVSDGYWPIMKIIYNYFHDKGLEIIGFSNHDDLQEVIEQNDIPWKNSPFSLTYPGQQSSIVDGVYQKRINVIDSQGYVVFSNFIQSANYLIPFLNEHLDGDLESPYVSIDYSVDGAVEPLQEATLGKGINVILMGDAFSDRQIKSGVYRKVMEKAMNAFFAEEPYKTFREAFNVYSVNVVSVSEGYENDGQALKTWIGGDGIVVLGYDAKVIEYALKAIPESEIDDALVVVLLNRDAYAGTCYIYDTDVSSDYGHGLSIAYFPNGSDTDSFNGLVSHEAGGHGFAKLADEYAYEYMGAVSDEVVSNRRSQTSSWGWWKNVDFTGDPTQVRWAQFIADSRYAAENIGCYEGAFTYWTGAWRPTENSIMRYNTGGFNAPSRYAIWYRINKLAYGDSWNGTYEDFVQYDAVNRTPAAVARRNARRNCVEKNLPPLAPPVVLGHSWRDAK